MFIVRVLLVSCCLLIARPAIAREAATSTRGMLATVHPEATDAGVRVMKDGGNAIDAAIAAALTLGVVDSANSGIGGGCFVLLRKPDGEIIAIDGRETAPAAARRDMYLRDGKPQRSLSKTGPLAVATPGALAAYAHAVGKFGKTEFADLLNSAADIAERGSAVSPFLASRLRSHATQLAEYDGSAAVFLKADRSPYKAGEILKQPDLATTYRAIASEGTDWFYRGPFAKRVGQWMKANDGILSADDFAAYRIELRRPIISTYRGYRIVGFPPPSSGGVHVAQILNIVEPFRLDRVEAAQRVHLCAEAMKLAFADRAHWLGDPEFARVPRGLIDKAYARQLARQIDPKKVVAVAGHGKPSGWQQDVFEKHTTHIAAADAEGHWIAITTTLNTPFGSKVVVPGTGVLLNNQMDDFSIAPGVPNAFGLIGAEANAIAPGKRPLSSMSPTIVLKDGRPLLTLGAAGGPRIISQVVLTIVNYVDLRMPLRAAVAAPRFHHQWVPDRLFVERTLPASLQEALTARGHKLSVMPYVGVTQAIGRQADGTFVGVHDPRIEGKAAGF